MTRTRHPLFARVYGWTAPAIEKTGVADHRAELLDGLTGRVVEVGAGSGLNFAHYPRTVSEVLAVEPEPHLRRLAQRSAAIAPVPVRVVGGEASHLPTDDSSFDVAVVSLVLCSVPDQRVALAELHRVLLPGGRLRFYEHVRSDGLRRARLQDRIDWIWPLFSGGCHANRDTEAAIADVGFRIESCRRFEFGPRFAAPVSPHVIGEAVQLRRP